MDKEECPETCQYKHTPLVISEGFGSYERAILFIANRGDERVLQPALFGNEHEQALLEVDSGRSLGQILKHCGIKLKDIKFTNILKCLIPQTEKIPDGAFRSC